MTFNDWWEKTWTALEMPKDALFTKLTKVITQTAWNMGRSEGLREASERFGTQKPDTDKEG